MSVLGAPPLGFLTAKRYFVRFQLGISEKESTALGIFKDVSEEFERSQRGVLGVQDRIMHSSFSEEDLVSNLIGFYRAVKGYSRNDVERLCKVVYDVGRNLRIWDKTGGTQQKNRTWKPVFHELGKDLDMETGCCYGKGQFPKEFDSINGGS